MRGKIKSGFVGLVALATMLAGAVTAAPTSAAGKFTGVSAPTISGTKRVGVKLTAKPDTSTKPAAKSKTYQWQRSGKAISGATKSTYTLKAADKGKKISVKVCYKASGFSTKCVTSAKSGKVATGKLTTKAAKVSGTAKVGSTLKASTGKWTSGTKLTYKWLRGGKVISGATKSSYKLKAADKGKQIQVKITGKKSGYATASKTSAKTKKVAAASSSCKIKGNIANDGEKIFHVPGQRFYTRTIIDTSAGERWFCSESAARSAGWRKSKL